MKAQGQEIPQEEIATPVLGKRMRESTTEDKLEEMLNKIQKLESELQKKDRIYKELQEQRSVAPEQLAQYTSTDISRSLTKKPEENVNNLMEDTESENSSEFQCDSVRVSSKPSRLQLDETMHMHK